MGIERKSSNEYMCSVKTKWAYYFINLPNWDKDGIKEKKNLIDFLPLPILLKIIKIQKKNSKVLALAILKCMLTLTINLAPPDLFNIPTKDCCVIC